MKHIMIILFAFGWLGAALSSFAQKRSLIVTTDIGQDPDDQQSMVRLLHYANEFNLLGLIANADANYDREPPVLKDSILHALISAYAEIEDTLRLHSSDYPTARYLRSIVKKGCEANSTTRSVTSYIGKGRNTEGSDWIVKAVNASPEPVGISIWGGGADVAQALWSARATMDEDAFERFQRKLRLYFIGKQDSSVDWIIDEFPEVWKIIALSPTGDKWKSGYRGMFLGGNMALTSREWLHRYVIGQNPLADCYPDKAYTGGDDRNPYGAMKEGDSPSWLYFLTNGLNAPSHPTWGGWGGRFYESSPGFYVDATDRYFDPVSGKVDTSAMATVYRWRSAVQQDFAARVQWGTNDYENANHHPVPVLKSFSPAEVIRTEVKPRALITLDASASYDPDGDALRYHWFIYSEAGTYPDAKRALVSADTNSRVTLRVPATAQTGQTIHLVLALTDRRAIELTSYQRIVVRIK